MKEIGQNEEFVPSQLGEKVVVFFGAPWANPSRMTKSLLESIEGRREGLSFVHINVDERGDLAGRYGIRSIPTVLMFKGGQQVGLYVGHVEEKEFDLQVERAFKGERARKADSTPPPAATPKKRVTKQRKSLIESYEFVCRRYKDARYEGDIHSLAAATTRLDGANIIMLAAGFTQQELDEIKTRIVEPC